MHNWSLENIDKSNSNSEGSQEDKDIEVDKKERSHSDLIDFPVSHNSNKDSFHAHNVGSADKNQDSLYVLWG